MSLVELFDEPAPTPVAALPPVLDLRGVEREFPGVPPVHALHPTDLRVEAGDGFPSGA